MHTKIFAYCTDCGQQGAYWIRDLSGCECAVETIVEKEVHRACACGGSFLFCVPVIESELDTLNGSL